MKAMQSGQTISKFIADTNIKKNVSDKAEF